MNDIKTMSAGDKPHFGKFKSERIDDTYRQTAQLAVKAPVHVQLQRRHTAVGDQGFKMGDKDSINRRFFVDKEA